jgi:hypothetical protein
VRHLRSISYLIAATGLATIVFAALLDLREMWIVAGMLMVVAGIVKIVMVHIWVNVAGFGSAQSPLDDT